MGIRRRLLRIAHAALRSAGPGPAERAADAIARRLDRGARFDRARAEENLRLFFPDRDDAWIARTARAAEANAVRAKQHDKRTLPALSAEEFERMTVVKDRQVWDEARREGRGTIVVSIHYGRHWAGPLWVSHQGLLASAFQKGGGRLPFQEATLPGGTLGARDRGAGLRAAKALKAGGVVFLLLDAGMVANPVIVDFLGFPTRVSSAPVRLARATDAVIVPAAAVEHAADPDKIAILFWFAVDPRELAADETAARTMRRLLEPFEAVVREDPAQWYGVHSAHRRLATLDEQL
jgi:lauroyl/myristoyl acyltransferase